ncbi:MAG: alpha-ketoacid dehydrogenase subunit beta [Dehalococcoidia bacterium]|nr:MAG: alpha-ketoacid dehydrogenase subunit beta [Dehalococcoidia bacterium]
MAKIMAYLEAANKTIIEEMRRDPTIFTYGEETQVGWCTLDHDGKSSKDLVEEFGKRRINFAPISETAMAGAGIGAALTGMRPIVALWFSDFIMVEAEQQINEAARIRFKLGNMVNCPVVFRINYGGLGGNSVQHSNCYYNKFADTPGLILAIPSTAADVVGLWRTALRKNINPVQMWESFMVQGIKGPVPEGDYTIPFGKADVKREGSDVTIAAVGYMVHLALDAAKDLANEGIDAEVWDPRTLTPFDRESLIDSVRKTGAMVVVDQEPKSFGTTGEFAMTLAEAMDPVPPMARVTLGDGSIAFSPTLEKYILPSKDKIIQAVRELLGRKGASSLGMRK